MYLGPCLVMSWHFNQTVKKRPVNLTWEQIPVLLGHLASNDSNFDEREDVGDEELFDLSVSCARYVCWSVAKLQDLQTCWSLCTYKEFNVTLFLSTPMKEISSV